MLSHDLQATIPNAPSNPKRKRSNSFFFLFIFVTVLGALSLLYGVAFYRTISLRRTTIEARGIFYALLLLASHKSQHTKNGKQKAKRQFHLSFHKRNNQKVEQLMFSLQRYK